MKRKLLKIIKHYGVDNQLKKLNEENFELLQALDRLNQNRDLEFVKIGRDNVKAEIADVLVLLTQFILYYDLNLDEIFNIYQFKINRQIKRIEKKENN